MGNARLVSELERLATTVAAQEPDQQETSLPVVAERIAKTLSAEAIQKIVRAPIHLEEKVIGLLQVSRKGTSPSAAGPDFSSDDLAKIVALGRPLGRLIPRFARD